VSRRASPTFQDLQRRFAAHIRDPAANPPPPDVSARRMAVYTELFFRSLEGHLADGFPVMRRITPDDRWNAMVRGFMRDHRARTPLFPALGREFVEFLKRHISEAGWPEFLPELADYEHLEVVVAQGDAAPRDDERASFMEINALTWGLLQLLRQNPAESGRALLGALASSIGHGDHNEVIVAGHALLARLRDRGVILGTLPAAPAADKPSSS